VATSFTVAATTAAFKATINGARQSNQNDLPQLTVGTYFATVAEWDALYALLTTTYAVHSPIGGSTVVLDVMRGAGQGTLVIDGLGTWFAVMTACERSRYLPNDQSVGSATFLLTGSVP
jgi:hypothetical protein